MKSKMNRREFLKLTTATATTAVATSLPQLASAMAKTHINNSRPKRPNILFITADDMNWDAPGCFGGLSPDITPNIDRLAARGMRFKYAHISIAVCQPSRSVLMTGRYPHRNGAEGFQPINNDVPTLQEQLHKAGYINGILGKVKHLAPSGKFKWSMAHDIEELGLGRDPDIYYRFAKDFFQQAAGKGRPFFLMANSHDPHRPFHASTDEQKLFATRYPKQKVPKPSRVYRPEEITVPGFLPDIPDVRKEVAQYYSSVRRCDDTVGAVMQALGESGQADNTIVMFISDNGMAFPFAKTNCYLHSTRTPWIVCWPGRVAPGSIDKQHFISGIDFMPTILDVAGLEMPEGMDGCSFLPLVTGDTQPGRDRVFTVFHKTAGNHKYPMRCVQDRCFGYIFNAWADGQTVFKNESQDGLTMRAMNQAAEADRKIAERVKLFLYRVPEELYDFAADPDARNNLAGETKHEQKLNLMRRHLLDWMEKTKDPLAKVFTRFYQEKT